MGRLVWELSGLDSYGPLSESLPRARHQFTERLFIAAKIQLTRVLVDHQGNALKFDTTILGLYQEIRFFLEIIHLKTYPPTLVSSFHVDD